MTTIVVTPIEFDGSDIELRGDSFHRFVRVKRLRGGESVRVVDGEGRARRGVLARVERAHAVVALAGSVEALEPRLRIELVVAPPEPQRAAWLVEKATELGVAAIRFVATERSARGEGGFGQAAFARLRRVAHAAVEQCGRAVVPELADVVPLAVVVDRLRQACVPTVVLDLEASRALPLDPTDLGQERGALMRLALLVGPEGGWSDAERARFADAGVPRWSIGTTTLRVETAALVAAGAALVLFR